MIEPEKIQPKGETGDSGEKAAKEHQECAENEQIIGDVAEKSGAGAEENITERFTDKPTGQPVKGKVRMYLHQLYTYYKTPLLNNNNIPQDIEETRAITAPEVLNNEDQLQQVSHELQDETEHAADQQKPEEYALVETTREYIKFTPPSVPVTYEAESKEENEVSDTHPLETKPEEVLSECPPIETNIPINYEAKSDSEQPREENEVLGNHAFETKLEEILFEYAPVETSIPIDYDAESCPKRSREENEVFITHSLENKIEEVLFEYAPIETSVPINNCDAKLKIENNVLDTSPLDINNELTDQEAIDVVLTN